MVSVPDSLRAVKSLVNPRVVHLRVELLQAVSVPVNLRADSLRVVRSLVNLRVDSLPVVKSRVNLREDSLPVVKSQVNLRVEGTEITHLRGSRGDSAARAAVS